MYEWEFKTTSAFPADISGLTPGTWYTVNVCSIDGNKKDWGTSKDFQTNAPTRPADWEWWSVVEEDKPIAFTVAEWSAFYNKINEFLEYRGQQPWPNFVPVSEGKAISAKMCQEVTAAIQGMTSATMPPIPVAGKTVISAAYFNKLRDYLNSIT